MRPIDIVDLVEASDPRLSPDGATVAFTVTRPDLDTNRNISAVWVAAADGSTPPVPFTDGSRREARPRWSPDGRALAYVAHPDDTGATLVVRSASGGEPIDLLEWPEDIEELGWAPVGTTLVFTARLRDERRYAPDKDRDRPARRIDRLQYRLDSVGWIVDRPRHLFVVATEGDAAGKPVQLTDGPYQDAGIAFSNGGTHVVFSSARTEQWDTDLSTHLYRVPIEGGDPEPLTAGRETHGQPSVSPDGSLVAFVWGDRHAMPRHGQVGVVELGAPDPPATERLITSGIGLHCAPYLAAARDPVWDTATSVLFQVDEEGNVPIYRAHLAGGHERVVGGVRQVTGFDVAAGRLAFTATSPSGPADLFVSRDGEERLLTGFAAQFAAKHRPAEPERFVATSIDGTEVEAWIIRPPGLLESERCPAILNIHGGPFSQYGNRLFDEFQVQVAAGYAVIYSNPRGSSGYSEPFARAIRGPGASVDPGSGWGGADYDDLMAVVDEAIARFDFVDPDRLGVMGGSYGGYMTSWIVGHTDRFRAAVSERALTNMVTFAHTADIGASFPAGYIGASHLDAPEEYVRQSPVTYWRDITTPLLILHSENDLRCPIEQAEDLFVRLRMSGKDVEFVRFPGESHELSRSGAPRHRVERHELILDWFARKLR